MSHKKIIADILGLETAPDGEKYMLLTRDEKDNVISGVSFKEEVDEIVKYIDKVLYEEYQAHPFG